MILLGVALVVIPVITFSLTSGGFILFGMFFVGVLFIAYGLIGRRSFICPKCNTRFRTRDSFQGRLIGCPSCHQKYVLKGRKIYWPKQQVESGPTKPAL